MDFLRRSYIFWMVGIISIILAVDRLTKWYFLKNPNLYFGDWFKLSLFRNFDFYFFPLSQWLIIIFTVGSIAAFGYLFWRGINRGENFVVFTTLLILVGGLSNLFDRIFFNFVIDWLHFGANSFSVINIADLMIVGGITGLFIFFSKK